MAKVLIGNIKGPKGDTGATGATGAPGANGAPGPAGAPGVTDYASTSSAGLVRIGDDFNVNAGNGVISIKGEFTKAQTFENLVSGEAHAITLGKIAKAIDKINENASSIDDLNTDLSADITSEGNSRQSADNGLQTAINNEVSARTSADTSLSAQIAALQSAVGSPLVASTKAGMTNTSRIYVYTGSESGMTNGNWYYYNGTDWISGGVYNAAAVSTDKTLSASGTPADALATGDAIQDAKAYIDLHHGGFKLTADYIESGGWVYSNKSVNVKRLRSQSLYFFKKGTVLCCTANVNPITVILMNTNPSSTWNIENVSASSTKKIVLSTNRWVAFVFEKPDNSTMSVSDYDSDISIYENYGQVPGKNVWIYQYGSAGNDWCFVRTPTDYDPLRAKPYPFVICNHGNGWVMNGSEEFANWTKRTMYVPINDPDYVSAPDQYNGTNDSSLWYSNPTIEALLNAGYIVCGAENYGDLLYGNENSRQGCVAFYEHMTKFYNVPDYCHMIGASAGALTAINASYILGGKVHSMILQYPLTCLVNHYFDYPTHREAIRNAYGITQTDLTEAELVGKTKTCDVLHTNVVNGYRTDYFPPTKLYYSTTDDIVNYEVNSIALRDLLWNSTKLCSTVQVDSDGVSRTHGDYAHFDPVAYLAWFDRFEPLRAS